MDPIFVLYNPKPPPRRGLPDAFYVSKSYGRSDTPGYLMYTRRVENARTWKTLKGVTAFLEANHLLKKKGYQIEEIVEILPKTIRMHPPGHEHPPAPARPTGFSDEAVEAAARELCEQRGLDDHPGREVCSDSRYLARAVLKVAWATQFGGIEET